MIRIMTFAAVLGFLAGCAGTGVKSTGAVFGQIDAQRGTNTVFVSRDTGYVGSAALISVKLNGSEVGKLGDGEVISALGQSGSNFIEVGFTGAASLGMSMEKTQTFTLGAEEGGFFIINLKTGLLTNELQLLEVSESTFKSSL